MFNNNENLGATENKTAVGQIWVDQFTDFSNLQLPIQIQLQPEPFPIITNATDTSSINEQLIKCCQQMSHMHAKCMVYCKVL